MGVSSSALVARWPDWTSTTAALAADPAGHSSASALSRCSRVGQKPGERRNADNDQAYGCPRRVEATEARSRSRAAATISVGEAGALEALRSGAPAAASALITVITGSDENSSNSSSARSIISALPQRSLFGRAIIF
ncbi:MAG: hypothetical protein JWP07_1592 [Pseudonocardiales bacterium]|nr:hypothetical protein [Pseudonocardiales bacterium]